MEPQDYTLPETDDALLTECDVQTFRATGPGGQGVNTTDSAVRLKHLPSGITVVCRRQRSQHLNKIACLKRLRERIVEWQRPPAPPRKVTRPSASARNARLASKKLAALKKQRRQPPSADE